MNNDLSQFDITLDGVQYQAAQEVESADCTGCAFHNDSDHCFDAMEIVHCGQKYIIWVKKEERKFPPFTDYVPDPIKQPQVKDTNPKDAIGVTKAPMSTVPSQVIYEVGVGMLEGALKYGRHNYRDAGVRASVYYDATQRHLNSWWEGEDIDPASGLSHVTKAIASLVVLRDAMLNDMCNDDRPPKVKDPEWMEKLNTKVAALLKQYPDPVPAYTQKGSE